MINLPDLFLCITAELLESDSVFIRDIMCVAFSVRFFEGDFVGSVAVIAFHDNACSLAGIVAAVTVFFGVFRQLMHMRVEAGADPFIAKISQNILRYIKRFCVACGSE